jgi:hypothetical protein
MTTVLGPRAVAVGPAVRPPMRIGPAMIVGSFALDEDTVAPATDDGGRFGGEV